jgi:maleate isomerase
MTRSFRLGVLTPSSNTALEPLTSAMAAAVPGCSAHFSRFKVTEIALSGEALGQFDDRHILAAAELLADAKVDVIGWSGTSAGWLGFDVDRRLVERIRERTGIPATTAVLALNELLALYGVTRLALVTPYTADVQQCIVDNYRRHGIEVGGRAPSRHPGEPRLRPCRGGYVAFADARSGRGAAAGDHDLLYQSARGRAGRGGRDRTGYPLFDTVSTTVWGQLRAAGADTTVLRGWGQLFACQ